jgi:hypothetical protein
MPGYKAISGWFNKFNGENNNYAYTKIKNL